LFLVGAGAPSLRAVQKKAHTGTKVEGFATVIAPDSITIFDKKSQELKILTDKDYTSLVGIASPVTVWYTTEGGVNHLQDIVYPSRGGAFVPSNTLGENIKRIIILPEVEGVENADGLISAISSYLADNAGWYVAPSGLATEIANRSKAAGAPLDAIDPNTGNVDMQRYLLAQGSLVTEIANQTHSDAVLEVKVLKVKANVHDSKATWDDMTEPVASLALRALSPLEVVTGRGWVYAVTADMSLWNQSGKLLWRKRRGFATLAVQSGIGATYRQRPLTEVYAEKDTMATWLGGTLAQLAPSVRISPAETSPLSPEMQKQIEKGKPVGPTQN
jgi:hypothetical protein